MNKNLIFLGIITVSALVFIFIINAIVRSIKKSIKRKFDTISTNFLGINASEIKKVLKDGLILEQENQVEPKSIGGATSIYLNKIEKDFPNFNNFDAETEIKGFITEYLDIKFYNKNNFTVNTVDKNILPQIKKEKDCLVSDVFFNKIAIVDYKKIDEYATITYAVSVGFKNNKNTTNDRVETRYMVKYTLRLSDNGISSKAVACPNCGASINDTSITICPYCDKKIISDTIMNWIISSIDEY